MTLLKVDATGISCSARSDSAKFLSDPSAASRIPNLGGGGVTLNVFSTDFSTTEVVVDTMSVTRCRRTCLPSGESKNSTCTPVRSNLGLSSRRTKATNRIGNGSDQVIGLEHCSC